MTMKKSNGVFKLDVRDSVPDKEPYIPEQAPEGAPIILFRLYDDTGMAAWSPFGGRINMPILQKLADRSPRYSRWHTTALYSPTRATLLTGRNHHLPGNACVTEAALGFPGHQGRIPGECVTIRANPPGICLVHLLAGQESQRARIGCCAWCKPQIVAASEWL